MSNVSLLKSVGGLSSVGSRVTWVALCYLTYPIENPVSSVEYDLIVPTEFSKLYSSSLP